MIASASRSVRRTVVGALGLLPLLLSSASCALIADIQDIDDASAAGQSSGAADPCPACETVAEEQNDPGAIAVDDTTAYWITDPSGNNAGEVRSTPKAGGPVTILSGGHDAPRDIALFGDDVYWTATGTGNVLRIPKVGGNVITLSAGTDGAWSLAVDSSHVFFSGYDDVMSVPATGGSAQMIAPIDGWSSVAIHESQAYWLDLGKVMRSALDGSQPVKLNEVYQKTSCCIAVDASGIYWTNETQGKVLRSLIEGGSVTELASGLEQAVEIALDETYVYWVETDALGTVGTMRRTTKAAGGAVEVIGPPEVDFGTFPGFAVDATHAYWTERTSIRRVPK